MGATPDVWSWCFLSPLYIQLGAIVVSPQVPSFHESILSPCSDSSSAIRKNSFAPKTTTVLLLTVFSICPFDIFEEIRSKFDVEKKALISLVRGFLLPITVFPSCGENAPLRIESSSCEL